MSRFEFSLFEIDNDTEEHLCQLRTESAYEAVVECLDPDNRLDYIEVTRLFDDAFCGDFSPYGKWGTLEAFEEVLATSILASKIQLNLDVTKDQATEALIVRVLEGK